MRRGGNSSQSVGRLGKVCAHLLAPPQPAPCAAVAAESLGSSDHDHHPPAAGVVDGEDDADLRRFFSEGESRALSLGNRGPLRFDEKGQLAQEILDAYWETGFYIFEGGVVSKEELQDLQQEVQELLENAPAGKDSPTTDRHGRAVRYPGIYGLVKPLSDPKGGSKFAFWDWKEQKPGIPRYQIRMREPAPPPNAPDLVPSNIPHPMAYLDSALRAHAHPLLLKVAEAINGPDFTGFADNLYYKPARIGTSSAWHQDPSSAWDEAWANDPGFDPGTCGFNIHLSLFRCTRENGLWILPGSHKAGRVDIKALSARSGGSDRLLGAVPILCGPGDVFIQNRLSLHGAFPNTSEVTRVTLQWGFQRKASVLGKRMRHSRTNTDVVYDEAFIQERGRLIQLAIDARRQRYPKETPYSYLPFRGKEEECRWTLRLKEESNFYGEYWNNDLGI